MKRKKFIKLAGSAGAGLSVLPLTSFNLSSKGYTRNQLIGTYNPDLKVYNDSLKIHKDAKAAFKAMRDKAKEANIDIKIVSAFRSFEQQKEIFERKYMALSLKNVLPLEAISKITEYSTIPGTSRHHWGTDLDIIDGNAEDPPEKTGILHPKNFNRDGLYHNLKKWLDKHAGEFGFFQVYTNEASRKGFKYEPWHFSFAPVAVPMLKAYLGKIDIKAMLDKEDIVGHRYFTPAFLKKYKEDFILGINPDLLPER